MGEEFRDKNGKLIAKSTKLSNRTEFRDSSGKLTATASKVGKELVYRNSKGETIAKVKADSKAPVLPPQLLKAKKK